MTQNNFAFIDSQNLYCAMRDIWRNLDYKKFRIYLRDKFQVSKAFFFIWYMPGNEALYTEFQQAGYILIFKPTLKTKDWIVKGNCDAELVLHTMLEYNSFDKAIIVSGDWDFHCLIEHLHKHWKLEKVIIPRSDKYSALLRKFSWKLFYLSQVWIQSKICK